MRGSSSERRPDEGAVVEVQAALDALPMAAAYGAVAMAVWWIFSGQTPPAPTTGADDGEVPAKVDAEDSRRQRLRTMLLVGLLVALVPVIALPAARQRAMVFIALALTLQIRVRGDGIVVELAMLAWSIFVVLGHAEAVETCMPGSWLTGIAGLGPASDVAVCALCRMLLLVPLLYLLSHNGTDEIQQEVRPPRAGRGCRRMARRSARPLRSPWLVAVGSHTHGPVRAPLRR